MQNKCLPKSLLEAIRNVVNSIASRRWDYLKRLAQHSRVSWLDVERELDSYDANFIQLPPDFEESIYFGSLQSGGYWVDCPLWTVEHEASDLEVQMDVIPRGDNDSDWDVQVIDVRVL